MSIRIGGYLHVDHSNSPGIDQETAQKLAKDSGIREIPVMPEGHVFERDTYQCAHCGSIIIKNPMRERPRNHCRKCNSYICDKPECNIGCLPMAKVFDKAESVAHKNGQVEEAIRALRIDVLGRP